MRSTRQHSAWFRVHRWVGVVLGIWFALVGLTGAALVYEDALDRWLNPELLVSAERGPVLAPEQAVQRALAAVPGHVERVRLPRAEGEVYRLQVQASPTHRVGNLRVEALVAPVSGRLLGTRSEGLGLAPPQLMRTLYEFHRNVLLGEPGSNIVGIAGFLLLASALTGIVLALPRQRAGWRRLVWINPRGTATRVLFDLHRSLGALVALLLVLATVTGSTLVYVNYVRDLVSVFSPVAPFPTIPWRATRADPRPLSELVRAVRSAYPQHQLTEIRLPAGHLSGLQFHLHRDGDAYRLGDTIAWVHPVTAEVLVERSARTRSAGESLMHWLFPLHSGSAFGTAGEWAMFVTGIAPLLLVGSGLWVWLRKRRGSRIGRARRRLRALDPAGPSLQVPAR